MTDADRFITTMRVLGEVADERDAQDKAWGEQNHPDGTGGHHRVWAAEDAKDKCERARDAGKLTFLLIMAEEVCEALAESNPVRLREKLIQVAAVAAAWIEAIDRRADA